MSQLRCPVACGGWKVNFGTAEWEPTPGPSGVFGDRWLDLGSTIWNNNNTLSAWAAAGPARVGTAWGEH